MQRSFWRINTILELNLLSKYHLLNAFFWGKCSLCVQKALQHCFSLQLMPVFFQLSRVPFCTVKRIFGHMFWLVYAGFQIRLMWNMLTRLSPTLQSIPLKSAHLQTTPNQNNNPNTFVVSTIHKEPAQFKGNNLLKFKQKLHNSKEVPAKNRFEWSGYDCVFIWQQATSVRRC